MNPVAAKTLNRSAIPKYSLGTRLIPSAPISIMPSAAPAHTPYERHSLYFAPAMIISVSDKIYRTTTSAVTAMCMTS